MLRPHLRGSVGLGAGILMHPVQEPEQELQSVMLGVPPELGGVLGHDALRREETSICY